MATFTIYLLRESIRAAADAVVADAEEHVVAEGQSVYGTLYVKARPRRPPKWATLFEPFVERSKLGFVQSTAAVFIVPAGGRLFALTFGHGRFILKPDAYEERFGLLTTLNTVQPDQLRSIDKRTFVDDQNSRVQTSQAAAASNFGIDIERDLIRVIVGNPESPKYGRRLAGSDALTVSIDAEVPDLKRMLRRYLAAFQSTAYKQHFPWVDQVRQLNPKSPDVVELNDLLVERLKEAWANNGRVDDCWLAVPDIIDWARIHGFKFTRKAGEGRSTDLNLPGLVAAYEDQEPSLEFLRARYAMAVDEEDHPIEQWQVYRCIHCEVDKDDKSYVLSAGHWFEVDRGFVDSVNAYFQGIDRYPRALPLYHHKDEGAYNEDVVNQDNGRWCLMDRKNLRVGGVYDKVEFCDIYGGKELLHIKHYGSSSVLGHLFNQGLVSGELLRSDADYVRLANQELGAAHQLTFAEGVPRDVSEYAVVFGIISQSDKPDLHLPFFAKVVLKSVCSRLRDLGYGSVMLAKIECERDHVLVRRIKTKEPRKRRRRRVAA